MVNLNRDDVQLNYQHIQSLSSADNLAKIFTYLNYPAESRLTMTAEALQLPVSLADTIQHAELLTEVDDGVSRLQVYLFKLNSVTVVRTKELARAFRDRGGNFLLVLTDDFTQLDFVLLEREIPGLPGTGIATRALTVVPRLLSVDRRDPGQVALRVLRRFTFTEFDAGGEPDSLAQYDKLRSAYAIAEWSEPYFNNRALFSDYYLRERLPEDPVWQAEGRNQVFRAVRGLFAQARQEIREKKSTEAVEKLVPALLEILGFRLESKKPADYLLYPSSLPRESENSQPGAFVLAYSWNRYLDGKDTVRDKDRAENNPGAQVVSLLEAGTAPWGIVTNGKLWRLYSAQAHSRATNYYEIDLEETLASHDPAEAFRYFYLFFRAAAYVPEERSISGEQRKLTFLDALIEESSLYAHELGERLKERVFEEVFPHFAVGFIQGLGGAEALLALPEDEKRDKLQKVFNGTLTFLYRLLFLLYAESRDLLPVREVRGYYQISLQHLKKEIAAKAGSLPDRVPEQLKQGCSLETAEYYNGLLKLFKVIDQGSAAHNVPVYNGGLFVTQPDPDDQSLEASDARFLVNTRLSNRHLALGLDRIARDVDPKRGDLGFIDYKSLGVRQLGSIYEGLLEFKLQIAPERMAVVQGKKTEEVIPYQEALDEGRKILTEGHGNNAHERIKERGEVYLINDRRERKATGSYYTPDYIVKYIVRQTVGPVLDEKLAALRPRLQETERKFYALVQRKQEIENVTPDEPGLLTSNFGEDLLALFDIKILDPAMGSGHFLVEAVDYITDRLVRFLDGFPFLATYLEGMRRAILENMRDLTVTVDPERLTDVTLLKRHVLKRCIYGVDLNPMAVELAKVSLWLDCFTLGAPLSFLDHHLRWGNSLIGALARELDEGSNNGFGQMTFLTGPFVGLLRAAEIMRGVSHQTDVTMEQVHESGEMFKEYDKASQPFKQLLDVYVAQNFGVERSTEFLDVISQDRALDMLKGDVLIPNVYTDVLQRSHTLFLNKRFFHWDLEFPEVFIDLERTSWKSDGGFDAVIGNPPYSSINAIDVRNYFKSKFESPEYQFDTFVLFMESAVRLAKQSGYSSMIVPTTFMVEHYYSKIRSFLLKKTTLLYLLHFKYPVFEDATVESAIYIAIKSSNKEDLHDSISTAFVYEPNSIRLNQVKYTALSQQLLSIIPGNDLNINIAGSRADIITKMLDERAQSFGSIAEITVGIKPYQKGKGHPKQTKSDVENRVYDASYKKDATYLQYLVGSDINRYEINPNQNHWLSYGIWLAEPRHSAPFNAEKKILIRQTGDSIISTMDYDQFLTLNNLHNVRLIDNQIDYLYILALLNSSLINFFHHTMVPEEGRTFAEVKTVDLEVIPIRKIKFTTAGTKRQNITKNLISHYLSGNMPILLTSVETLLPENMDYKVLPLKESSTSSDEKTDIVYDLLVYLSNQMLLMKKERQNYIENFWFDLATVSNSVDIETLRNKGKWEESLAKDSACLPFVNPESHSTRKLNESLGWDEKSFEAFAGMLIGKSNVTPKMLAVYRKHHPAYKELVDRIKSTDTLIDQIVYRLYGLTQEEIAVVEGSVK